MYDAIKSDLAGLQDACTADLRLARAYPNKTESIPCINYNPIKFWFDFDLDRGNDLHCNIVPTVDLLAKKGC